MKAKGATHAHLTAAALALPRLVLIPGADSGEDDRAAKTLSGHAGTLHATVPHLGSTAPRTDRRFPAHGGR